MQEFDLLKKGLRKRNSRKIVERGATKPVKLFLKRFNSVSSFRFPSRSGI
jgi:hypothetical protein